ncbi:hypothetical protein Save01_03021 [Streptomyces avermitilis]|uniref:Cysteinyl-tRNA synthetase n=2 Tax=Streptomyces avermitilis TaxID=33903 RepID=Q826X5_STRAW|nr:hypothetical protein SAVERM_7050 [Streptomyces avermitilis MA-4680 = NBRC 14893]BBJ55364.1 hypothetical protein SAVMC3_79930 [Streptomyces avermitilis]GDY67327.1 hypothetical protein SAV14893_067200 [Streptomyces avermitilis]GDY81524.1 hypothetical protein SAVCW2_07230 [Streptomyces avermitilis]
MSEAHTGAPVGRARELGRRTHVRNGPHLPAPEGPGAYAHPVLRITDAGTGEPTDVRPGLTRIHAHVARADTSALRVLLVADVLARALELGGTPVVMVADPPAELRARADALGIRRAETDTLGGGRILHVLGPEDPVVDGIRVEVAPAGGPADSAESAGSSSAVRLALLAHPRSSPADLDSGALTEAQETLARWRKTVALWANHPSKPIPEHVRQELRAAWEDDLDLPAVLDVLRRLEGADDVPDGARFESYAYADRLLGLELTREIGAWA